MSEKQNNGSGGRIEKIIRFFRSLKVKKPACDAPDDGGRDKTEAEYQQEQARWLAKVDQKRKQSGGTSKNGA